MNPGLWSHYSEYYMAVRSTFGRFSSFFSLYSLSLFLLFLATMYSLCLGLARPFTSVLCGSMNKHECLRCNEKLGGGGVVASKLKLN